jgi:dipeptidyl aminopeptidase/acylaminoacyl peptidase
MRRNGTTVLAFSWACVLILIVSAVAKSRPLDIQDAVGTLSLAFRAPITVSPDGTWVAYTVEDDRKRESTSDARYLYYTRTGVYHEAVGCDIWLTNIKTGETRNLTEGRGTSWDPVWSPDERYLAFYSDRSGVAHLWVWERESDRVRQLSDAIVRPFFNFQVVRWSPDSRHVLLKVLPEKMSVGEAADLELSGANEMESSAKRDSHSTVSVYSDISASKGEAVDKVSSVQSQPNAWANRYLADLAMIDVATGRVERMATRVRALGYWISPDGKFLAYTSFMTVRPHTQQDIYELSVVTLSNGKARVLVPDIEQDYGVSVSWAPDSKSLAYTTAGPLARGDCFVVPLASGEPRDLTRPAHPPFGHNHRAPLWDADGRNVYFISSESDERLGTGTVWKASVSEGTLSEVATIPGRVLLEIVAPALGGRFWSPDGGISLTVSARNEATKDVGFYRINVTTGAVAKLFEQAAFFGGRSIFTTDVTADNQTVAFALEDANHPTDIWVASPNFSDRKRLTTLNPHLTRNGFGSSILISWHSIDGQVLQGALLLPANYQPGTRYPLVVNIYGGAYESRLLNRFGLSGAGVDNMQILATRGYAVLLPDTPLNTDTPMQDILKTVMPGLDTVVSLGIADPDRLGVMGHSYGGYSTLALIVQTTRFRAAIDSAGVSDLVSNYGYMDKTGADNSVGWAETGQGRMGGTPWQYRARYIENSPVFYLDQVKTPLLLVHGELDRAVPCQQAEEVFIGLRRLGKEVVYAKYTGEEHWPGTWSPANITDYWNRVIEWFDRHLQPSGAAK